MRGITKTLLCCSAAALGSGAWGQTTAPTAKMAAHNEVQQLREEITRLKIVIGALEGRLEKVEDAPSASSTSQSEAIALRTLPKDDTIEDKRSSPLCDTGGGATARILENPNRFQKNCLGLVKAADFDTVGLSSQLTGNLSSSSIEMSGSYTWRNRPDPAIAGNRFATSYKKLRLGARSKVQDGKPVEFADLSRLGLTPGLVGFGEFEFGVHGKQSRLGFEEKYRRGSLRHGAAASLTMPLGRSRSPPFPVPGNAGSSSLKRRDRNTLQWYEPLCLDGRQHRCSAAQQR
jgi:hypothetical protein